MQRWTTASLKMDFAHSSKPDTPSILINRTSSTPRPLSSSNICIQENYRQRRKDTLENLAKNIAFKVKRTGKPVTLEPMNPYERRVIHSALQNDRYVETHSEGEEPFRRVVVTLKEGVRIRDNNNRHRRFNNNRSSNLNYNKKGGGRE